MNKEEFRNKYKDKINEKLLNELINDISLIASDISYQLLLDMTIILSSLIKINDIIKTNFYILFFFLTGLSILYFNFSLSFYLLISIFISFIIAQLTTNYLIYKKGKATIKYFYNVYLKE